MRRMLDLCSGMGGASEYFVRMGWDVVRIENNPELALVPGTTIVDIFEWDYEAEEPFDFIWFSPPCTEFSTAYNAPRSIAERAGEDYLPDLTILVKGIEIIDFFKMHRNPDSGDLKWCIENVSGASKWFNEIIGAPPWQIVGPFHLWGNFPRLIVDYDWTHNKRDYAENTEGGPGYSRAQRRGKIPLEISKKMYDSLTGQPSIMEWI